MSTNRSVSWVSREVRWLLLEVRPHLAWHLASFLCISAASLLALLTPLTLKWLIDEILPRRQMALVLAAVVLIFLGYQGRLALTSLGSYLTLSAAQRMALALRMRLFHHLNTLSADYYDRTPIGTVAYPLKEPIEEISSFGSDLLPAILRMLLATGFTLVTMAILSPALTMAILPVLPVFLITRQYFRTKLAAESDGVQFDRRAWSTFLEEHLSSVVPIQLLRQQHRQERRAFRLLVWTMRAQEKLFRTGAWFAVWTSFSIGLAMSAVIGYGGWRVLGGTLSLGTLVAFYSFVTQIFDPLSGAADLYSRSQKTFSSIRQVQELLTESPTLGEFSAAVPFPQYRRADIELVAVTFGYRKQKCLLAIPSLRILPGEQIAIVGENGAGKSSLAKLIARIYDVDSGCVRIGGEDVRRIRLESLRRGVCYLQRDPVLFDGTLASNLRFVRSAASACELHKVIRCVGLADFVATLPDDLQQRIGPGGRQLSDGQRQRLALARALLQRPQILILDEATSCLDAGSEVSVLREIRRYLDGLTLIVITHRLSTVSAVGRMLVLSGGRIIEDASLGAAIANRTFPSGLSSTSGETAPSESIVPPE